MHLPLSYEKILLRILFIGAIFELILGIIDVYSEVRAGLSAAALEPSALFGGIGVPLAIALHQTLRLWRRRWWLVICELLTSLLEITAVIVYFIIPAVGTAIEIAHKNDILSESLLSLTMIPSICFSLAVVTSSFILFLFLLLDVRSHCRVTIRYLLQPYDHCAGSYQSGYQWKFLFGQSLTRKRFSTDSVLTRCVRGIFAALTAIGILSLAFYTSIWQPLQWRRRPGAKIYRMYSGDKPWQSLLNTMVECQFTDGNGFGWPLRAALALPRIPLVSSKYPTMSMNLTEYNRAGGSRQLDQYCNHTQTQRAIITDCFVFPLDESPGFLEILLTIKFSGMRGDFQLYIGLHSPRDTIEDILTMAEPIGFGPGLNIHGWGSFSAKERFSDEKSAIFGIPKFRRFAVMNLHALSPDWLPSLPRDNDTSTFRTTVDTQTTLEVEQEYMEGSVLSSLAVVGGLWTLISGAFAAIFGSTLLLVLFGIKPLSIYGLVHHFRLGKGSLMDGGYVLSPEERDRVIGILREHLLDVDDAERGRTSLDPGNSISVLPQYSRSQRGEDQTWIGLL